MLKTGMRAGKKGKRHQQGSSSRLCHLPTFAPPFLIQSRRRPFVQPRERSWSWQWWVWQQNVRVSS